MVVRRVIEDELVGSIQYYVTAWKKVPRQIINIRPLLCSLWQLLAWFKDEAVHLFKVCHIKDGRIYLHFHSGCSVLFHSYVHYSSSYVLYGPRVVITPSPSVFLAATDTVNSVLLSPVTLTSYDSSLLGRSIGGIPVTEIW